MRKAREVAASSLSGGQWAVSPSRERLCHGQQHWGALPPTFHTRASKGNSDPGWGLLSSVEVASDKMKATSRCITRASTEDIHHIHTPPRPRVTDPIGEGDPKPQAPISGWGACFSRGDFFFKVYEHLKIV